MLQSCDAMISHECRRTQARDRSSSRTPQGGLDFPKAARLRETSRWKERAGGSGGKSGLQPKESWLQVAGDVGGSLCKEASREPLSCHAGTCIRSIDDAATVTLPFLDECYND